MTQSQDIIVLGVALVMALLYLIAIYWMKGREAVELEARHLAFSLMLTAEKKFGTNKGALKMDWVANKIYAVAPLPVRLFLDQQDILTFLEIIYREGRQYLECE